MGLFADLNHAWVTIDNSMYLWDYTLPDPPLIGFEEQPHTINAVGMVWPRAGVFLPSITRLLVIATTTDLYIIGVAPTAAPTGGHAISLYSTGMKLPTKGMDIDVITGSIATGRIFFSGRRFRAPHISVTRGGSSKSRLGFAPYPRSSRTHFTLRPRKDANQRAVEPLAGPRRSGFAFAFRAARAVASSAGAVACQ